MCEALGPPHILGASRAAKASPGGVYEKTRFRKNRKFWSQLFKLDNKIYFGGGAVGVPAERFRNKGSATKVPKLSPIILKFE